jgi:hypothetical protein
MDTTETQGSSGSGRQYMVWAVMEWLAGGAGECEECHQVDEARSILTTYAPEISQTEHNFAVWAQQQPVQNTRAMRRMHDETLRDVMEKQFSGHTQVTREQKLCDACGIKALGRDEIAVMAAHWADLAKLYAPFEQRVWSPLIHTWTPRIDAPTTVYLLGEKGATPAPEAILRWAIEELRDIYSGEA